MIAPPMFFTEGDSMEAYKTILKPADVEFVEKRSRFIGHVRPVSSEEEALAFLAEMRSKHWNASHNVYAYCVRAGGVQRYSDDGEPQGTAGIPTLDVLRKSGVTDVAAVVTRYFGGILLGAGGLVRAYSHSVSIALEEAGVVTMRPCAMASIACAYSQYGRVAALVPEHGGVLDDTQFGESVTLSFHIVPEALPALRTALADATCGECSVEAGEERYFACS